MARTRKELQVNERHIYQTELTQCPHCGAPLVAQRHYQWRKTVQHLDQVVYVASQGKICRNAQCPHPGQVYSAAAAQRETVPGCTYGLDVIVQVGWWREQEHLNRVQIHGRLRERSVQLSEREVDHLYAHYQVLQACAARLDKARLTQLVAEHGGLIISLDGLAPEGAAEQLWVVREVQTDTVLVVGWLPRVNYETLAALLQPVAALELPLLATVSDKEGCVKKALTTVWPDVPHQWCQAHYVGNAMKPIYARDSALKTELRQQIRAAVRASVGEVLTDSTESDFSPQLVGGLAVTEPAAPAAAPAAATREQVVRALAHDLQQALARQGRAPRVLSGLPLWADLQALRDTLAQCLQVAEEPHLRQWYTALEAHLPAYAPAFAEVQQAQDWVTAIAAILDQPLPTATDPGVGGDAVALDLAHHLGRVADLADLPPWLTHFRDDLLRLSARYWSGLFHCYDQVGLPATNNAHESLFGQTKRQLRRQRGISELREALLRHGAWLVFRPEATSPEQLQADLAQVSWAEYATERARYDRRQAQFHQRSRWRHHRDAVLQQRLADWVEATSTC